MRVRGERAALLTPYATSHKADDVWEAFVILSTVPAAGASGEPCPPGECGPGTARDATGGGGERERKDHEEEKVCAETRGWAHRPVPERSTADPLVPARAH